MMAPPLLLATRLAVSLAALAGSAPPKRPNMPAGWTWPPSTAMKAAGEECKARLDAAEVAWKPGAAAKKIAAPVVVPTMTLGAVVLHPLRAAKSHPMDCQLAAGITEVSAALAELGVAKIRFRSLHEYRFVKKRGRTTKILSRHALGLAI